MSTAPPPTAWMGSESVGTGTEVIGIALKVQLPGSPSTDGVEAEVVFEAVGSRYGPVTVPISRHESSAPVPIDAICGLGLPGDTQVLATLVSITRPFVVDRDRDQMGTTVNTLCHHLPGG